jgi:hypothetical protein
VALAIRSICSVTGSADLNNIDPQLWLSDRLELLNTTTLFDPATTYARCANRSFAVRLFEVGVIFQPFRFRALVVKFFCENHSLQKPSLQRHPIGFLGVVEQAEVLGNGLGGQTGQVGSWQSHERFRLGAGHGDL